MAGEYGDTLFCYQPDGTLLWSLEDCSDVAYRPSAHVLPMTQEEYDARTRIYRQQKQETGKGKIRIGKNMEAKTHACLISWDALDQLSDQENAITGGNVDYKQMDRNNILLLPELLRIRDQIGQ